MPLPFSRRATQTAPSFSRDFAGLKTLDHGVGPAITFTRASNATFFDANGTLQTAANDTPRFDHAPATGASRGLLIEEARTNLLVRSAELDNASWTKTRATISANAIASPDGGTNADTLVEDSSNDTHFVVQNATIANGAVTFSIFVKVKERTRLRIQMSDLVTSVVAGIVDLSAGTITTSVQSPWTNASARISSVGNGWYRVSLTATSGQGTLVGAVVFLEDGSGNVSYTGDGTSGLYIWGAQLEAGAFATSYIPTTTAAATRAADSAVVTPISSFYNQSEGTLFAEAPATYAQFADIVQFAEASSANNRFVLFFDPTGTLASFNYRTSGALEASGGVSVSSGAIAKIAAAFAANDARSAVNGTLTTADTSVTLNSANTHMVLGRLQGADSFLNGHIRKLAYWPRRLSNTLLQQLTT